MPSYKVVAVNSTYDENTRIATSYRDTFLTELFNNAGFDVEELSGLHANKAEAQQAASQPSIVYLTGVAHGESDSFTGDQGTNVFSTGDYDPAITRGRIVHFLACNTGLLLGRNMADPRGGGAKAFFGYKGLFSWPKESEETYADLFFDCDAEIDRSLIGGKTTGEAFAAAFSKFSDQIAALKEKGDDESLFVAAMLEKNRDLLCGPATDNEYGKSTATLL